MIPGFPWLFGMWLGAASLITIFYLVRERRHRVFVPFLDLFVGPEEQARRESWRGWLRRPGSLLLQLLLLTLLAFALTECSRRLSPKRETLVLVVDTSASMGLKSQSRGAAQEKTALDRAKERAGEWIRSSGADSEFVILEMSALPKVILGKTRDPDAAVRAVHQLEVKSSTAHWTRALELARGISGSGSKRTIVFSDDEGQSESLLDGVVLLDLIPGVSPDENLRVRSFSARRSSSGAGQFEATYELSWTGAQAATVLVEVERLNSTGDRAGVIDAREVRLTPGESRRGEFRELRGAERALRLTTRLLDHREALLADNMAFAVLPEERLVRVLCVGPESLYLRAALLSVVRAQITGISAAAYPPRGPDGAVLGFDLTTFGGEAPPRVRETGPAIYLGATGAHLPVSVGRSLEMFGFDEFEKETRLFRHFDPYETMVLRGSSLVPGPKDFTLGTSGGRPILVRGERGEGAFLSLGFAPEASDLVLRPGFPLFIRGAVEELLGAQEEGWLPSVTLGRTFELDVPEGSGPIVEVSGPLGGARSSAQRRALVRSGRVAVEFEEPGIYALSGAREGPRLVAVNFEGKGAGELDRPRASSQMQRSPPPPRRSEWWKWALGFGLVLALFEFVAFHRRWTA